jgi:hypothetical protein
VWSKKTEKNVFVYLDCYDIHRLHIPAHSDH